MVKRKWLDGDFKETKTSRDVCYIVHEDGDVELCTNYDTKYPWLAREEILKLAEILKGEK